MLIYLSFLHRQMYVYIQHKTAKVISKAKYIYGFNMFAIVHSRHSRVSISLCAFNDIAQHCKCVQPL